MGLLKGFKKTTPEESQFWTGEFKDGRLPDNLENIARVLDNGTPKATRSSLFPWQNVSWKVKLPIPWNMKLYALCLG